MTTCVITGCDFIDVPGNRWAHGDLHEEGDCWVFNGIPDRDREGQMLWNFGIPQGKIHDDRCVLFERTFHGYFLRRTVLVVAKGHCSLNTHAKDYLGRNTL